MTTTVCHGVRDPEKRVTSFVDSSQRFVCKCYNKAALKCDSLGEINGWIYWVELNRFTDRRIPYYYIYYYHICSRYVVLRIAAHPWCSHCTRQWVCESNIISDPSPSPASAMTGAATAVLWCTASAAAPAARLSEAVTDKRHGVEDQQLIRHIVTTHHTTRSYNFKVSQSHSVYSNWRF